MWRKWRDLKWWFKIKLHQGVVKDILNQFKFNKIDSGFESTYDFIRHQAKGRKTAINEINDIKKRIMKVWKISSE